MDKKQPEQQTQPVPAKETNEESAILKMLQKMDSRLSELETNIKQPAKPEPIPQPALKFYENKPTQIDEVIKPEYVGGLEPKTYGELRDQASQEILKEREEFLFNQKFGSALQKAKVYKNNEMHIDECAVLGIYEDADSRFKEIIKDKVEMLKNCDYVGLAETSLAEDEKAGMIHKILFGDEVPLYDEKSEMLKTKILEIAAKRY